METNTVAGQQELSVKPNDIVFFNACGVTADFVYRLQLDAWT